MSRRRFLFAAGAGAVGAPLLLSGCASDVISGGAACGLPARQADSRKRARIQAVFLYPPSKGFADDPNGWWSWPGTEFDAEGRQKHYAAELAKMADRLGVSVEVDSKPVANLAEAKALAEAVKTERPDGLLVIMFYNRSIREADLLLKTAESSGIPAIFYIGLGVKHGSVAQYRRPGVHLIQSLDNFEAIEYGLRMVNARKLLAQSRLLSITNVKKVREDTEPFLGINVRTIPTAIYVKTFKAMELDDDAQRLIQNLTRRADEVRVTREALANAARVHMTMRQLIAENDAHGVTMNCLRAGMLKPCMSFALLNGQLFPAACENDKAAAYGLFLGEALTGRAGFQHNPAFETERNHYFGSHCTCAPRLHGPDGPDSPHILRKFFHSNEGSCAIQTFWKPDEPVTMIHYYSGQPASLDVYAGKVYKSHHAPPAGGCTTNVEIEITDRKDAFAVKGHHNILFCGDFAQRFRQFANLYKMKLV